MLLFLVQLDDINKLLIHSVRPFVIAGGPICFNKVCDDDDDGDEDDDEYYY